ncbi:hypothetical protein PIN31115_03857 [Pandoraea iniqua]|uniref:Uncharacterized protein n=1 Tax=Pandoraea iniqua TaxID=2508288 RepID=A0A5E4XGT8_9BURK|nr:hypothetical protein [Pandoraea iniqua]VVE35442.1 hypothetical protein PIN31115_03857 [Pandoraea iniqua]
MARSAPSFDQATQHLLSDAAVRVGAEYGHDATALLDHFILAAYDITHGVHSAKVYLRLLAGAGVAGLPSESTVQRAITRMRSRLSGTKNGTKNGVASGTASRGTGGSTIATTSTAPAGAAFVSEDVVRHLAKAMALLSTNIFDAGDLDVPHRSDAVSKPEDRSTVERLELEIHSLRMQVEGLRAQLMAARMALAQLLNSGLPSASSDRFRGTRL